MSLSRQDVERVALLARLELSHAEVEQMTLQLAAILDYVDQLGELDTERVEPMSHAVPLHSVFAPDQQRASLARDEALANAPKRDDACYRVPAVLGE